MYLYTFERYDDLKNRVRWLYDLIVRSHIVLENSKVSLKIKKYFRNLTKPNNGCVTALVKKKENGIQSLGFQISSDEKERRKENTWTERLRINQFTSAVVYCSNGHVRIRIFYIFLLRQKRKILFFYSVQFRRCLPY